MIIAEGQVDVRAKTGSHGIVTLNTYGPGHLLCD
jgi:hypothetical protein